MLLNMYAFPQVVNMCFFFATWASSLATVLSYPCRLMLVCVIREYSLMRCSVTACRKFRSHFLWFTNNLEHFYDEVVRIVFANGRT